MLLVLVKPLVFRLGLRFRPRGPRPALVALVLALVPLAEVPALGSELRWLFLWLLRLPLPLRLRPGAARRVHLPGLAVALGLWEQPALHSGRCPIRLGLPIGSRKVLAWLSLRLRPLLP